METEQFTGVGAASSAAASASKDEAFFIAQIQYHWNKQFESIIEVGRLLEEAAATMNKRGFRRNFIRQLPFTYSVAQRLRKLAKDPRINDPKHRPHLPASWNTLAAIMTLSERAFLRGLAEGTINPKCQYKDIKRLREEDELDERFAAARSTDAASVTEPKSTTETADTDPATTVIGGGKADAAHVESDDVDETGFQFQNEESEEDKAAIRAAFVGGRAAPKVVGIRSTSTVAELRRKTDTLMNSNGHVRYPLFVRVGHDALNAYRTELAALIEDLNRHLPETYPFISEVRMEDSK